MLRESIEPVNVQVESVNVHVDSGKVHVDSGLRTRPRRVVVPVPLWDALALAAAAATDFGVFAATYGALAVVALNLDPSARWRINPRVGDEMGWVLARIAIACLLALPVAAASDASITAVLSVCALSLPLVVVGRASAYAVERRARARGRVVERALIVGTGEVGSELVRILEEHPEFGLRPIGMVGGSGLGELPSPLLGSTADLEDVVRGYEVSRVLVAFDEVADRDIVGLMRALEDVPAEVHAVPRFWELSALPSARRVDDLWGIPLVHLRRPAQRLLRRVAKRAFDLAVAGVLLLVAAPVLAAAALAVKLSSPGPVLFRQRRIGLWGREFQILKFRTMLVNGESDTLWSVEHDGRVTGIGKLLRRTGLDELPQLLNVIRGDMSLVGPRPERPRFVREFRSSVRGYDDRHRMPVGVTGWAQVHGLRGDTSIPDRARFDNAYIEHWSFWRDLVIMARTIVQLFKGEGR